MQPEETRRPVTTSWIVRMYNIPASTVKRDARSGRLPSFREAETPKLLKYWREDAQKYAAWRKHVL